eukprot:6540662-Heterocapsa_arctica.AAC.1
MAELVHDHRGFALVRLCPENPSLGPLEASHEASHFRRPGREVVIQGLAGGRLTGIRNSGSTQLSLARSLSGRRGDLLGTGVQSGLDRG